MFRARRLLLHHVIKRRHHAVMKKCTQYHHRHQQFQYPLLGGLTSAIFVFLGTSSYAYSDSKDSVSEGAAYLRKKILPFRESYVVCVLDVEVNNNRKHTHKHRYRKKMRDDMPLPRVRILKQGTSTYVASFAVGTDADVIAMISALIRK